MKKCFQDFKEYLKNYKYVIIGLFLLGFATYFIRIFFFSISIDTEAMINDINTYQTQWLATGRWVLVLLQSFTTFEGSFNPILVSLLSTVLFVMFTIIVNFVFSKILNNSKRSKLLLIMSSMFIITSPLIAEQLGFTLQALELSICFVLLGISMYFLYLVFFEKKKLYIIFLLLFLTFVFSSYQAFVPLFIAISLAMLLLKNKNIDLKNQLIELLKIALIVIGALIICFIVTEIIKTILNINSAYLNNQIKWGREPIKNIILRIGHYGISTFGLIKENIFYSVSYLVIFLFSIVYCFRRLINKKKNSIIEILLIIGIFLSPYLLSFLLGSSLVPRMQFVLPFSLGFLFYYFYINIEKKFIKNLLIILVAVFGIIQFRTTNDIFYSDYMSYNEDRDLINQIFTKIDLMVEDREKTKIVFVGIKTSTKHNSIIKGDMLGSSFFEWDLFQEFGPNYRIHGLAKSVGINYVAPSTEEIIDAKKQVVSNSVYPAKNSIVIIDNYVIVKLSN